MAEIEGVGPPPDINGRASTNLLHQLGDGFERDDIRSFCVVFTRNDGTTEVEFGFNDPQVAELNKIGGGLLAAVQRASALSVRLKTYIPGLKGNRLPIFDRKH